MWHGLDMAQFLSSLVCFLLSFSFAVEVSSLKTTVKPECSAPRYNAEIYILPAFGLFYFLPFFYSYYSKLPYMRQPPKYTAKICHVRNMTVYPGLICIYYCWPTASEKKTFIRIFHWFFCDCFPVINRKYGSHVFDVVVSTFRRRSIGLSECGEIRMQSSSNIFSSKYIYYQAFSSQKSLSSRTLSHKFSLFCFYFYQLIFQILFLNFSSRIWSAEVWYW